MNFDIEEVRAGFPILKKKINGYPLAYFDSAASAQRPLNVIKAENSFYQNRYAAVHRGIHSLSTQATSAMEKVRYQIKSYLNANFSEEIIFVKGTTEAINLIANSWGGSQLKRGDNIIITVMEHHSNIVPWQIIAERTGAYVNVLSVMQNGELDLDKLEKIINDRTRLLAVTHVSNVLGTINPIKDIVNEAKKAGIVTVIDGAQAIMHQIVDVQDIGCDFYVFSGHKMYGPNGIGVLYGRKELLEIMPPWEGGGSMINKVVLPTGTTFNQIPWRFEAGTPNTGGIIGLGAAISYIKSLGLHNIHEYENMLINYALTELNSIPNIIIYGPKVRTGVIAFNLGKYHAYDVGCFLDKYGIAIRTGHHCAMPLMQHYEVPAMCRASFAFYNTIEEINRLVTALKRINYLLDSIDK
ncbi:cysteine desulfurase SufS [Candidatus Ishikawella capsulata]|nr:cysteine desulfurase SufS [Candidatus Ishikawaella capsulata]